jgi:ribosomal protein L11
VWVKAQLDNANEYFEGIKELIKQGKLFLSSGAMQHLVKVDKRSGAIKTWPWIELSLTPTPANPMATVEYNKAKKHYSEAGLKAEWDECESVKITSEEKAEWTAKYIGDLPDSSFAFIESGGEKDDDGKTAPRKLRHFPYKDNEGNVDAAHVRNALARIPQSKLDDASKERALNVIRKAAKQIGIEVSEKSMQWALYDALMDNDPGAAVEALDETPLTAHCDMVATLTGALDERVKAIAERRLKEGRMLSNATKKRLRTALSALSEAMEDMAEFLDAAEPTAKAASARQKVAILELAAFEQQIKTRSK